MCQREGQNWLLLHPGQVPRSFPLTEQRSAWTAPHQDIPTQALRLHKTGISPGGQLPYVPLPQPSWRIK